MSLRIFPLLDMADQENVTFGEFSTSQHSKATNGGDLSK
jgi:hypothetical protein